MYFDSLQAALEMSGHGPYVWSSYLLTFAVIAALLILPIQKARRVRSALRAELRRRAAAERQSAVSHTGAAVTESTESPASHKS